MEPAQKADARAFAPDVRDAFDAVGFEQLLGGGLHVGRVDGDEADGDAVGGKVAAKGDEVGHLGAARAAPRSPGVEHDHVGAEREDFLLELVGVYRHEQHVAVDGLLGGGAARQERGRAGEREQDREKTHRGENGEATAVRVRPRITDRARFSARSRRRGRPLRVRLDLGVDGVLPEQPVHRAVPLHRHAPARLDEPRMGLRDGGAADGEVAFGQV